MDTYWSEKSKGGQWLKTAHPKMELIINKLGLAVSDAILLNLTVLLALYLRFEAHVPAQYLLLYGTYLALGRTLLGLGVFWLGGLYRSLWRYASVEELLLVLRVVTLNAIPFGVVIFGRLVPGFPRSVVVLAWIFDLLAVAGVRFLARVLRRASAYTRGKAPPEVRRVLVVGAGEAGSLVVRELYRHEELRYHPVGFVDDDPSKQGMRIAGVAVLGTRADLPRLIRTHRIHEVIIAMPSVRAAVVREITEACGGLARLRIVPGVYELIGGQVSISQIRDVEPVDLLNRRPVEIALEEVAAYLRDQVVLITGAGGSIGSELARQVARYQPGRLVLLGNEENSIYEIEGELRQTQPGVALEPVIANIRDAPRMQQVFSQYRPAVVFHAAAHKHVPLMELHPDEAIKNNVTGTRIVAECALRYGTRRFVLISTDKAVNPTSVMGASKRVAEQICQHLSGRSCQFMAVRFGNVLGSRGSVVPLFKDQIQRGGPVTITHPDMVRFFMTIPEAVALVIQAGAIGQGGEVFVLDMGEPMKIVDLARNLIRLSGLEPDRDVEVVFTGVRPGEKLYEEILTAEEGTTATRHARIFQAMGGTQTPGERFFADLTLLEQLAEEGDDSEIRRQLTALVPSYTGGVAEERGRRSQRRERPPTQPA